MAQNTIHYELFIRKTSASSWSLHLADEDREGVLATAETLLSTGKACGIKVTKEVMEIESGGFRSYTILSKGLTEAPKKINNKQAVDATCTSPQDLYNIHSREIIGRVLEDWLKRNAITPFELLHRPDLVEKLEASGTDLQHAIQKLAIPESHESGKSIHEIIRHWNALTDRACERVMRDGRKNLFAELSPHTLIKTVNTISTHPERAYVLGGAVARLTQNCRKSMQKLETYLPYMQILAENYEGRDWAMAVFETPLLEIFQSRTGLAEIMGADHDLGHSLCILTRLAAASESDLVCKFDASSGQVLLPLKGVFAAYQKLIMGGKLSALSAMASRRIMTELKGPRRLRPGNPTLEIETLRALAMVMTATGKTDIERDDSDEAFSERSKTLVASDFVDGLLQTTRDGCEDIDRLIWLSENVVGGANKRQAARWLLSYLGGLKFERDIRDTARPAVSRLTLLSQMQKRISLAKLPERETQEICDKLGHAGFLVANDANLISHLLKSQATAVQKLNMLLKFAVGESAPKGPLTEQAKLEAVKFLKNPTLRQALSTTDPTLLSQLRPMMLSIGLVAE